MTKSITKVGFFALIATIFAIGASASFVSAQTVDVRGDAQIKADVRARLLQKDEAQNRLQILRTEVQGKQDAFRAEIKDTRNTIKTDFLKFRTDARVDAAGFKAEVRAELQAADSSDARTRILDAARDHREELRRALHDNVRDMQDRRLELKTEIKTEVGTRIKIHLENMLNRLDAAVSKFSNTLDRIGAKLEELRSDGVDVSIAAAATAEAESSLAVTTGLVSDAKVTFERALQSDAPREHLDDVKQAVRDAIAGVKETKTMIANAIAELKALLRANAQANIDTGADVETE